MNYWCNTLQPATQPYNGHCSWGSGEKRMQFSRSICVVVHIHIQTVRLDISPVFDLPFYNLLLKTPEIWTLSWLVKPQLARDPIYFQAKEPIYDVKQDKIIGIGTLVDEGEEEKEEKMIWKEFLFYKNSKNLK